MKTTAQGALIAREGYPFIALAAGLCLTAYLACWAYTAVLLFALTVWVVWFFRNPPRIVPEGENLVICPADGRVLDVIPDPTRDGEGVRVAIFMNVFNVHVNRLPVSGEVVATEYIPGSFINASFDKASEQNERNRITMITPRGHRVVFVQIAGLVARRIVSWARSGMYGAAGDIFGLIRFGSRVDVHLPDGTEIWVRAGQRVTAGETVLGRLP
ncbi:MAG: phosphatidylserine decarboxylase family protein [Nitrospirae bacterium]|nr:phosphatidylserine decarboxylase family protein [Nitrospirota bacterium]